MTELLALLPLSGSLPPPSVPECIDLLSLLLHRVSSGISDKIVFKAALIATYMEPMHCG